MAMTLNPTSTGTTKVSSGTSAEKFKHGEVRDFVIATLTIGLLVGGILITPNFPIIFGTLAQLFQELKKKKIPEAKVKRVLKNLEKKEIIYLERRGSEVYVHLKDWLQPKVIKYSLKSILSEKSSNKKWSGKWFLVFFDVPEKQRNKRDYFRSFLREIGFYQYQQSVYVFPYECEKEISLLKKIVEGGKYISYVIAEKIENEKEAKIYFGLN